MVNKALESSLAAGWEANRAPMISAPRSPSRPRRSNKR